MSQTCERHNDDDEGEPRLHDVRRHERRDPHARLHAVVGHGVLPRVQGVGDAEARSAFGKIGRKMILRTFTLFRLFDAG